MPTPSGGIATPNAPLAIAGLLLAIVVVSAGLLAYRRGRSRAVTPEGVYGSVARLATRVGFGPRPNETVYEFTGALAQAMPVARPDLTTVANAKVEVAYGRQTLGSDRLHALRDAQRRIRVQLLRLFVRRQHRR